MANSQINKSSIVNFATNFTAVVYLSIVSFVPNKINFTDPVEFNKYPEYLWVYELKIYLSPLNQFLIFFVLILKNEPLRNYFKQCMLPVSLVFHTIGT